MTLSALSLTKRYGNTSGYDAVRDASLELRRGEFVSIVGRSGSGKSTLMAMLGALTPPTAGKVLLDGTDIWALPEAERAALRSRHIGFVFQFPSLLSNLTAVDNVAVPALLGRTMDPRAARSRAFDLLARVGLENRADAYPGSMSGREQRRVVVARALINSPPLLLADEPTSDLDEDSEADIIDLLADLQRGEASRSIRCGTFCGVGPRWLGRTMRNFPIICSTRARATDNRRRRWPTHCVRRRSIGAAC